MKQIDKKKIAFVEPMGAFYNGFANFMNIPLLGPVILATIAERAGYDVSILNENILGRKIRPDELESIDTLCLSCITATANRGKEIAGQYKSIRQSNGDKAETKIGGIHASMMPYDVEPYFDQVVVGEAENIILDLLAGNITDKMVSAPMPENLDELPIPNFKLIKGWEKMNVWPVMTSRGCPHNCNFCSVTKMFGRKYRTQSPERAMEEISRYEKGAVFFSDDHFAANINRTNNILDMMIANGFNRPWSAQVRTEVTKKPEFIAKMKKAGCTTVYCGFESIIPESLEKMDKGHTVEDIERSIKVYHDNGIEILAMWMLGNDSDPKDVFERTSSFSIERDVDYVQYWILTPLPGTPVYSNFERDGRLLHTNWDYYDVLHATFNPRNMTAYELQQGAIKCFKEFYSYTRGMKKLLSTAFNTAITPIKKTYTNAHFLSLRPALMRMAGRRIVDDWVEHNQGYLGYLSNLRS